MPNMAQEMTILTSPGSFCLISLSPAHRASQKDVDTSTVLRALHSLAASELTQCTHVLYNCLEFLEVAGVPRIAYITLQVETIRLRRVSLQTPCSNQATSPSEHLDGTPQVPSHARFPCRGASGAFAPGVVGYPGSLFHDRSVLRSERQVTLVLNSPTHKHCVCVCARRQHPPCCHILFDLLWAPPSQNIVPVMKWTHSLLEALCRGF